MNPRVAVLQFPGINSEYETLRALWDAQIDAEFFRWNADPTLLATYDGFVIPGGFSYEDRGRSGLIASMDSIMQEIRRQADSGKPVLGICNGAQILVESGLIPGALPSAKPSVPPAYPLLMSLARNKRVRAGKVIGVGFYNENVHIKSTAPQDRCAFTQGFTPDEISGLVPIAHGEGRFTTTVPGLLEALRKNHQIVFKYCDAQGQLGDEFPLNPNGALDSAAAICNPAGNVMAIMPHPERAPSAPMPKIFTSMRKYMEARAANQNLLTTPTLTALLITPPAPPLQTHAPAPSTLEFFVQLLITDNEAQTLENALRHHGFALTLRKWKYYKTSPGKIEERAAQIHNPNKEKYWTEPQDFKKTSSHYYLVTEIDDNDGTQPGTLWEVTPDPGFTFEETALLQTHVFANPNAQILQRL